MQKNYYNVSGDFYGGAVDRNTSASAGDTGSTSGREDSTSRRAMKPQLPSLRAAATDAHKPSVCAPRQEKLLQGRGALLTATRESPCAAAKTQRSQKSFFKF